MTITMYQASRNFVTPDKDASLYSALVGDTNGVLNRGEKLTVSPNGLVVTVHKGQAVIQGRLVDLIYSENITVPANTIGKICITVDLSKMNDATGEMGTSSYNVKVNQVYLSIVTGDPIQDDLNNGGIIYQLPIASFNSTATSTTVQTIKHVFNDTGWNDLDIASTGAKLWGSNPYAQYRVKNGIMYLRWRGVDVTNANNGNQIARVPWAFRPDVEIAAAAIDIGADGIYPTVAYVNETTTLWVQVVENHMGNLCGSMNYPLI